MSEFVYEALSREGSTLKGVIAANTREEALRLLSQKGMQPLSITAGSSSELFVSGKNGGGIRLSSAQTLAFIEELSDLIEGGLQLEAALKVMQERQASPKILALATYIRSELRDGNSLSRTLRTASPNFGEMLCSLVEAGEHSGSLDVILKRQVEFMASLNDLKSKVQTALIYPSFLIVGSILLIILFMTYLVPQLTSFISQTGGQLPFLTRMLIETSKATKAYWPYGLMGLAALSFLCWGILKNPKGLYWWHTQQLKLPLFGPVIHHRIVAQITHTLGTLVSSGMPLLQAIKLTTRAISNRYIADKFEEVTMLVEEGASLSSALKRIDGLPGSAIDMITVGEQTGNIGQSLLKIAKKTEKDLNKNMQRLTTVVPIMITVLMACMIGLIAFAIVNGIYNSLSGLKVRR